MEANRRRTALRNSNRLAKALTDAGAGLALAKEGDAAPGGAVLTRAQWPRIQPSPWAGAGG